jgi:23S rRNA (cytosine1962-C5)-methyltransferase
MAAGSIGVMAPDHELIDAGDGRRLERFGHRLVDRPAAGATDHRRNPAAWAASDLRFEAGGGWQGATEPWTVDFETLTFELRATASGQVGLFPEQATNWRWLTERAHAGDSVLNLFGYTGAATLAAAKAGAEVVHLDSARAAVAWARRNAELSGLAHRSVRWIVDDVEEFVCREARRQHRYDGIVLDPPSYGHGRGGRAWRLDERLPGLLEACREIATPGAFVLLTAHSQGIDAGWLADRLGDVFGPHREIETLELELVAHSGARLWLGSCARMIGGS